MSKYERNNECIKYEKGSKNYLRTKPTPEFRQVCTLPKVPSTSSKDPAAVLGGEEPAQNRRAIRLSRAAGCQKERRKKAEKKTFSIAIDRKDRDRLATQPQTLSSMEAGRRECA